MSYRALRERFFDTYKEGRRAERAGTALSVRQRSYVPLRAFFKGF
jgi:hypothetical protein